MITCLGMILSIVALCITFIVCIAILYNIIFWVDEHIGSVILIVLTVVLCSVITCFSMGASTMLVKEAFRKPVDIIVFDECGNYICEYNEIEKVNENEDGMLEFEYNGRKHVIQNYSWKWSDK